MKELLRKGYAQVELNESLVGKKAFLSELYKRKDKHERQEPLGRLKTKAVF